ncbi:DNA damage-induced apoptosis suppressor protein isoform X2 [Misgurnus anguillicaudatus]|uniref:DNA damage-induced apoptosis suppressor protein isoform X2 n=1 Tax=Misgurnus anguillicaudatus TaxID=75329 RepID=UPI003CCFCE02
MPVVYALMSNTRALLSCTVLSLQDSSFVYPSCKNCLSRINQETSKRATCARCGFSCDLQNVDYRYRLSLKVSRNQDIFGVTVFGGCLNSFFGITAGGLQKFIELEKSNGKQTIQQLLIKAVEDCFIGRCVVFGLKVSCDDVTTWSANKRTSPLDVKPRQLLACQIISPSDAVAGFTVIGYLKNLLNSNLCSAEFANSGACLSQEKDSQSSQRDELNSFDYTLPSCARINSQPSSGEFTLPSAWPSPGLRCSPGERCSDSLQQSRDYDIYTLSPKNEDTRACHPSLKDKCLWACPLDELKHVNGIQDELKNERQRCNRISLSSSCDMFEPLAHFDISTACDPAYTPNTISQENDLEIMISGNCLLKAKSGKQYDAPFDKSPFSHSDQNICLDLEDAPLSENLLEFVKTKPQLSGIIDELNHEEGKYFRHRVQTMVHSVNCKVKQEQTLCDDHVDTYNCSADLFASCQNSMDMNHSDVTEISKVNEPKNVNQSEPGVSGSLHFSPCLQSTPVSYQHPSRQKTGKSKKRVDSLSSKGLKLEFKSNVKGLKENIQNKPTMSEFTERCSDESDMLGRSCNSSINLNEWSKDLFENSF